MLDRQTVLSEFSHLYLDKFKDHHQVADLLSFIMPYDPFSHLILKPSWKQVVLGQVICQVQLDSNMWQRYAQSATSVFKIESTF